MTLVKKRPSIVYWLGENLYLNLTNRCSNNCYFCFRRFKSGIGGFNLKLSWEPPPKEIIKKLGSVIHGRSWSEVVFCGFGEPLERLDCLLEVSRWIKKHCRKVVRVDTNGQGYLLNRGRKVVKELKGAGVEKVSVSLNAHNEGTYNRVCKPRFENSFRQVLEFVERAQGEVETEITTITIPEVDVKTIRDLAVKMGVRFRVRRYIPCFW